MRHPRSPEVFVRTANSFHRNLKTITFAAPVEINSIRGNVAVVVKSADKNRYKAHRILTPDGNLFSLDNK